MSKAIAEQSNALSIFWLKKHAYFPKYAGERGGSIKWVYGSGESSVGFLVIFKFNYRPENFEYFTEEEKREWKEQVALNRRNNETDYEEKYIRLNYIYTDRWTGEKSEMDFKIPLATTPCNYGGVRYWFICSLYKNGQYCGRRVGVLFSIGKWFGCRHCGEIAYAAQMRGGKYRGSSVCLPDIERAEKEVKRYYYNGKPTRKYRRVMRLNEKFERGFMVMAAGLDKRFSRFADLKKK